MQEAGALRLQYWLAKNGHNVTLWSAVEAEIKMLSEYREHKDRLPGVKLPDKIVVTNDLEKSCKGFDLIVFSVASPYVRNYCQGRRQYLCQKGSVL